MFAIYVASSVASETSTVPSSTMEAIVFNEMCQMNGSSFSGSCRREESTQFPLMPDILHDLDARFGQASVIDLNEMKVSTRSTRHA